MPFSNLLSSWLIIGVPMHSDLLWPFVFVLNVSKGLFFWFLASYNPFNFGDNWVGTFNTTYQGRNYQGGVRFAITQVIGLQVQLLGTFTYGGFCNTTAGCLTPGVSQYYLTGNVNGQQLVAVGTAWAPITDRTFPPQGISGFLSTSGQTNIFSGNYGSGTFRTTLACSAAVGLLLFVEVLSSSHFYCLFRKRHDQHWGHVDWHLHLHQAVFEWRQGQRR